MSDPSELSELSAWQLSQTLERGEVRHADLVEKVVSGIERLNPALNAFIGFDPAHARADAAALSGGGSMSAIPVALKDNILTSDAPTTCGSRILGGFRSPVDATVVARLRSAGAWIVGKTNLDEFAMGSSTENSAFGVCRNPWDLERVSGGSSGGSACAVAARLVPVALGSDTGGSVRQPAAFCGVIGLKPTWGRVSRSGLVAFASSLDQIGVLSRTARDSARVLNIIAGHDPADSTSSPEPVPDYEEGIDAGVSGKRFGVIAEAIAELKGEVRENFDATMRLLERGGAVVEVVSLAVIRYAIAVYYIVANAEASANLARFDGIRYGLREGDGDLRSIYFGSRGAGFGPEVQRRILLGTFALSAGYHDAYYGRAQAVRSLMRRAFDEAFARYDFLVTPTTPGPAFRVGEKTEDPLQMYLSDVFTAPANLVGIPAIAVPSGFTPDGLPLSLQIMGPHFSEGVLLRAAHFVERETGHARRVPPMVIPGQA